MIEYLVRTDLTTDLPEDPNIRLLDWAPDSTAGTIQVGARTITRFLDGWHAPREALDLFLLGAAVYCADKVSLRSQSDDSWTRDITVDVPVGNPAEWESSNWSGVLDFLTGDRWNIRPYAEQRSPLAGMSKVPESVTPAANADAVSLFSGGLDSLTGVIDFLEEKRSNRICLLSHNEGGKASTAQVELVDALIGHYGEDRIYPRSLYLRPAQVTAGQARSLPPERESTTRSRSLLFLAAALSLAASIGTDVPVYIPENGFIGINVPLTRARTGSNSTRTTHPHYMELFENGAAAVGVRNPIVNPFRLKTKGEILAESRNPKLLRRLAPLSISCSHPEAARYANREQGNCGYCFPCLIRRSSMAHVGWDSAQGYAWDALTGKDLLDLDTERAADLRAVINGVFAERPDREIFRNGPIPNGEHREFLRVWRTGLAELQRWFANASGATEQAIAGLQ